MRHISGKNLKKKRGLTLRRALISFQQELEYAGLAPSSRSAYVNDIQHFYLFIQNNFPNLLYVEKFQPIHIVAYDGWLEELEKKQGIYNERKHKTLKRFFAFLSDYEHIKEDPYKNTIILKRENRKNKNENNFLSAQDIMNLIEAVPQDKNRVRNEAIITVLAYCGARVNEILSLNWSDVDFNTNKFKLTRTKNKTWDFIEMNVSVRKILKTHFDAEQGRREPDGPVFKNDWGKRMSYDTFYKMFKRLSIVECGLSTRKITPHVLRHSFCSQQNAEGKQQSEILRFTGHRQKESLKNYIHVSDSDLEKIIKLVG